MSIDKWLKQDKEEDSNKKVESIKKIQEQQLKEVINKKIEQLKREIKEKQPLRSDSDDFLSYFV